MAATSTTPMGGWDDYPLLADPNDDPKPERPPRLVDKHLAANRSTISLFVEGSVYRSICDCGHETVSDMYWAEERERPLLFPTLWCDRTAHPVYRAASSCVANIPLDKLLRDLAMVATKKRGDASVIRLATSADWQAM